MSSGPPGQTHPSIPLDSGRPPEPSRDDTPRITLRALVLGALTIAATFYYYINEIQGTGMLGHAVSSQLPVVVYVPFVLWLFLNVLLKQLWPRLALRRGELLTIFGMLWVVGTIPGYGWMGYWVLTLAAPAFYDTAENQWAEILFDFLPWHVFPDTSARVIDAFWLGLPEGAPVPWDGWFGATAQWLSVSVAMVGFGLCLVILLQRQWEANEKLTFPLAQLPLDLTAGFDGAHGSPAIFRSRLFWVGFAVVFVPVLYNITSYFMVGLPRIGIYWDLYNIHLGEGFPTLHFRIMPLVVAVTYLCPLDILASMVVFHLLAILKGAAMSRIGFSVGSAGESLQWNDILHLESYGAIIFIGLWTFWLARSHFRRVWRQVRWGAGEPDEVSHHRRVLLGLTISGVYLLGWMMALGMSLPAALLIFSVALLTYVVVVKLIAATGCAYLLTDPGHIKGITFVNELLGTALLSPRSYVGFRVFSGTTFFGNLRIPAWPSLPHLLRIFSLKQQPGWIAVLVLVAFPVGFLVAAGATLEMAYTKQGLVFFSDSIGPGYDETARNLNDPTSPDLGRWLVFLFGFTESAVLAILRVRFHWFPLHPVGVAFQYTIVGIVFWFSLFLAWAVKVLLLRFGGKGAYLGGKPFFYGLAIGYVSGIIVSVCVDLIWFPTAGHNVHSWFVEIKALI